MSISSCGNSILLSTLVLDYSNLIYISTSVWLYCNSLSCNKLVLCGNSESDWDNSLLLCVVKILFCFLFLSSHYIVIWFWWWSYLHSFFIYYWQFLYYYYLTKICILFFLSILPLFTRLNLPFLFLLFLACKVCNTINIIINILPRFIIFRFVCCTIRIIFSFINFILRVLYLSFTKIIHHNFTIKFCSIKFFSRQRIKFITISYISCNLNINLGVPS